MKRREKLLLVGLAVTAGLVFFQREALADVIMSSSLKDNLKRWEPLFKAKASKYGLDWTWLAAIAWNESSLGSNSRVARGLEDPNDVEGSKSSDGLSWGLMQVTLKTAQGLRPGTTVADLNNPDVSVELAAKYLSQMLARYKGDLARAVKAYNQGPGNEDKRATYADEYLNRFTDHLGRVLEMVA